jgi:tRNA A-37 threonylcarbamoyl transferase component Bud32
LDATPEPPLVPLLRFVCRELAVEPRRITASGVEPAAAEAGARASAFLGAGGSARVFCVAQLTGAELRALKVSSELSRAELTYEFKALKDAAQAGAPVVPVVDGSLTFFIDDATGEFRGGGFLLRDVCTRVDVDSAARCTAAFAALRALHALGFAHGDARVPNLLTRGSGARAELVWIDLRAAAAGALESAQRADGRTLAASVLNAAPDAALPLPVVEALAGVPSGGSEAYAALAAAVWAAYGAPARA